MKYARMAMLEALNTVKPALAAKDLIEELTHVWFDGETMTAHNDADLGIQVPFKTDFKGGVRGSLLLGLLHNSRAKELDLEPTDDGHMKLVAARTRAKLAVLDSERQVWAFPKFSTKNTFDLDEHFLRALKTVMVSVGNDTSIPEKLGVTIMAGGGEARMFTTDSRAITAVKVPAPKGAWMKNGARVILPTAFCEQVLRLCASGGFMEIAADRVVAGNGDGVLVYARQVDCPMPLDLTGTVAQHTKFPKGALFEIPPKLAGALDRAIVLLEGVVGERVSISTAAGKLRLEAHAEGRGNVKDYIDLPEDVPEIELQLDPALVKRAIHLATHMALLEDAAVLTGDDDLVYLASTGEG